MSYDLMKIDPIPLPFNPDDKIFQCTDDEGNIIGDPYSYNDYLVMIKNISGVSKELLSKSEEPPGL
jgi:hypothetical protein